MIPGRRHWLSLTILTALLTLVVALSSIAALLGYIGVAFLVIGLAFSTRLGIFLDALAVSPERRLFAIWACVRVQYWLRHAGLVEPDNPQQARVLSLTETAIGLRIRLRTHVPLPEFVSRGHRLASLAEVERVDVTKGGAGIVELLMVLDNPLSRLSTFTLANTRHHTTPTVVDIGKTESGAAELDLSNESHIAIQGMTRSGKSSLATTILEQLREYQHVHLTGIDPSGLLLTEEPRAVRGTSEPQAMQVLLDSLVVEMDRRIATLALRGESKMQRFTWTDPLIVVVLEEAPSIIRVAQSHSRQLADGIQRSVARLTAEGAKAGIRLIVLAQRFDANLLGGEVRQNFGTRITLRVPDSASIRMLHENTDDSLESFVIEAADGVGLLTTPTGGTARFRAHLPKKPPAKSAAGES